jgi:pyroglutamyl-peptidase
MLAFRTTPVLSLKMVKWCPARRRRISPGCVADLVAASLPASLSLSAGSFVCNHVFFSLMHALQRRVSVQAGFMHLPWLPEQVAGGSVPGPCLALTDQVRGVRQSLLTTLAWRGRGDLATAGGSES